MPRYIPGACLYSGYRFLFSVFNMAYSCFSDCIDGSFFKPRESKYRFAA